jgi:hypothetical protein
MKYRDDDTDDAGDGDSVTKTRQLHQLRLHLQWPHRR